MLGLFLAAVPQDPAPELPDPVAFVQGILAELDAESAAMWRRQAQIWGADEAFGTGGPYWSWEDPVNAAGWSRIRAILRAHLDPALGRWHEEAEFADFSRVHLLLLLAKSPPLATRRVLRLAAEDADAAARVVAVEIQDLEVPASRRRERVDWVWLRAHEGRWVLSGLELVDPAEEQRPPRSAGARPWQRSDEHLRLLTLRWAPPAREGGARRLLASFDPLALESAEPAGPYGAERLALELRANADHPRSRRASDRAPRLHLIAPADVPLDSLAPLLAPGAVSPDGPWQLFLRVEMDRARRPGALVFEQGADAQAAAVVSAGAPLDSWPPLLREGTPPARAGIALAAGRTLQELCATADALLARGVASLHLAPTPVR